VLPLNTRTGAIDVRYPLAQTIATITASQKSCECAWCAFVELKAATREAINESRELMAEIDAALAKR
jgi:hypothetical protein